MAVRADELVGAFARLASALDVDDPDAALVRALAVRCGWGARPLDAPLLPSGVRHGVPWGVSMVPGTRELRVFVEAQAEPASLASYAGAAAGVTRFAAAHGAVTTRLDAIAAAIDLAGFRIWHALAVAPGEPPRWHAYLCVPPDRSAIDVLRAAGVTDPGLAPGPRDRISIVSLDLAEPARVKAYVLMADASLDAVARVHDRARGAVPGDAERFGRAMLGDRRSIWWLVCAGYEVGGASPTPAREPAACALHFGVPRHVDEPTARARIAALLAELELEQTGWRRATAALGAHHFVSFQRRGGRPRVTTYFVPEVRR